jgi:rhodanese-related sulfurtransferase
LAEETHLDALFAPDSPTRLPAADNNRDIVICASTGQRAQPGADHIIQLGYRHVYYLAGGYPAWQNRYQAP